ncbi:MAG: TfoX family protein [Myxococcales bacterium]|jgi:TfoX/Sxy family transcriptional regulator of competence genes|nr:MAG: TfoX family protein [Myxococcales bacterium]
MSFDHNLAERIRLVLKGRRGISEKKMFGGLSFLVRGNMCCGVVEHDLMVRVGPAAYEEALARPRAREMDFTGRPLKGMVYVDAAGVRTAKQLQSWVDRGIRFAASLPAK